MVLIWGTYENHVTHITIDPDETLKKPKFQITISIRVLLQIYVSNGEKMCILDICRLRVYKFGAAKKRS